MRTPAIALAAAIMMMGCSTDQPADSPSNYAGMEQRTVKALSDEQVQSYLNGDGMGLAMVAELNHYPGPKHVLEIASDLGLTEQQERGVRASFDAMKEHAVALGRRIVTGEAKLDSLFANGLASPEETKALVSHLGMLQSELRYAHVAAHIAMREILLPDQITEYDQLRGYSDAPHEHVHQHEM